MEMNNSISINNHIYTNYIKTQKVNALLDGLIEHRRDLGKLGRQLVFMLRINGVKASLDPMPSTRYH